MYSTTFAEVLNDEAVTRGLRYRAAFVYVAAIGWAADQRTNGRVPAVALPFVHANKKVADLLVYHRLWEPNLTGWTIHNYDLRQDAARQHRERRYRWAVLDGGAATASSNPETPPPDLYALDDLHPYPNQEGTTDD